ncbi:MAG: helix-turn-helix domain-containing protein [Clostridia bacterium]|nr:helix-turn-helix domain-containing protein [Clostridia bacterium]
MSFGEKIAELRRKNGMTQNDLGKAMNVSYQAVSKWERDESQPDFDTMSKIAKLFDVPISYFEEGKSGEQGNKNPNLYYAVPPVYVAPPVSAPPAKTMLGTCTQCGKVVYEGEAGATEPKLVCKPCKERMEQGTRIKAEYRKAERKKSIEEDLGRKWGVKPTIAVIVALALYILFMVLIFSDKENADMYSVLLAFVPLCGFGIVFSVADFINDLRDKDDDDAGYRLVPSLITAACFTIVNIVLFLVLYLSLDKNYLFLILLGVTAVCSFTFVSQFMWGGVVGEIFSAGGFTFKLPGFIFSLSIDSILWMVVTKILLSIVAAIVFVATTVVVALVAILGSVFIFIPSLLKRIYSTRKAKQELKEL